MATTQVQYTISGPTDKTHSYGSIEMPPSGLSIVDSDLLVVTHNGATLTLTTDYTVNTVDETVILDAGYTVASTDTLVINRVTSIEEPYIDFTNNTAVDAEEVDLALMQLRFRLQELETDLGDLITYNTSAGYWDGKSRKTQNFMPATALSGLVTLEQLRSELDGTQTATVEDVNYAVRSGDASTTVFALADFPVTDVENTSFLVFVSGVKQRPTTDFTVAVPGTGQLTFTFTTAPASGTNNIEIMSYKGSVQTGLDTSSLDGAAIIDGTLDPDAVDATGATANSYLTTDGSNNQSWDTLVHSDITDWDVEIAATPINDLAAADGTVDFGTQILDNVATPTQSDHGATKGYVDTQVATVASNPAGSDAFMEPYDTDASAEYTDAAGTSQSVTGLTAGTYVVFVSVQDAAAPSSITCGGITRAGRGFSQTVPFIVTTAGTITVTCGGTDTIRNLTGFRIS